MVARPENSNLRAVETAAKELAPDRFPGTQTTMDHRSGIFPEVIRLHGGQISAENAEVGGLCVEIVLPLAG